MYYALEQCFKTIVFKHKEEILKQAIILFTGKVTYSNTVLVSILPLLIVSDS